MFAGFFNAQWVDQAEAHDRSAPPKPRPMPIFIGDAVLPWNGTTMLHAILQQDAERKELSDD